MLRHAAPRASVPPAACSSSASWRIAQWRRRLARHCPASSLRRQTFAAGESAAAAAAADAAAAAPPPHPPPPPPPRRRTRTRTRAPTDDDAPNVPAAEAAEAAEAAQRRHRAALERRLGRAGLGLPAATVQRVARRSAAPRGGVPSDPSVVAARALALHRLLGPALAARVLYTHPTILGRDDAALARNLGAWRATLTELDERAGAARARDRREAAGAGDGDDGDGDDGGAADEDEEEEAPASPSSSDPSSSSSAAMLRRLTKVPALLALRPERAVPHLFETAVLLGVPPRGWDAWAAGRAPHLASLRPDTVAAKLAAAHAALNWRPDPLESPQSPQALAAAASRSSGAGAAFSWLGREYGGGGGAGGGGGGGGGGEDDDDDDDDDEQDEEEEEPVTMDQVRAAARRDHRWLLYASGEVRLRLAALARALEEEGASGDGSRREHGAAEDEEEGGGAARRPPRFAPAPAALRRGRRRAARRAAATMFLRQPSLVCKPSELLVRRLRAFTALPGIEGDEEDEEREEREEREDKEDREEGEQGGGGGIGRASPSSSPSPPPPQPSFSAGATAAAARAPLLPRSLRALESMPSLLNLQPEALQARWRRVRALCARGPPRWRAELGRMAPSTLAGVLALSERRVEARAARLLPVLEALEAAEVGGGGDDDDDGARPLVVATPRRRRRRRRGGEAGEGEGEEELEPPPKAKRPPALRSLAYELKCTERAFVARRRAGGAVDGSAN